jgi:hypothetical protein
MGSADQAQNIMMENIAQGLHGTGVVCPLVGPMTDLYGTVSSASATNPTIFYTFNTTSITNVAGETYLNLAGGVLEFSLYKNNAIVAACNTIDPGDSEVVYQYVLNSASSSNEVVKFWYGTYQK